jgi:hypothetical protein
VTVTQTSTVVNCPVLGFGQKRIAGFSNGRTIHYYDLGPVKVAAGNVIAPLYTVTNPVGTQQHNIAEENIAPGQTKYPPLWGIIKVTFKAGVKPHLLTSYKQIEAAKAAGQVAIAKTTLVVNCPVIA